MQSTISEHHVVQFKNTTWHHFKHLLQHLNAFAIIIWTVFNYIDRKSNPTSSITIVTMLSQWRGFRFSIQYLLGLPFIILDTRFTSTLGSKRVQLVSKLESLFFFLLFFHYFFSFALQRWFLKLDVVLP